jgi:hypothetical protein
MHQRIHVLLMGEQPVPNLLCLRFRRADTNILVCSETTRRQAENVHRLLASEMAVQVLPTGAYDPRRVRDDIITAVTRVSGPDAEVEVNLTGGTKLMMLGAFLAAQERGWPCLYLQSESGRSQLRRYRMDVTMVEEGTAEMPCVCSIDDFLKVHGLWRFTERGPQDLFERQVADAVGPAVEEIKLGVYVDGQIELDQVVRSGNSFGVVEVKTGKKLRKGLHQLSISVPRESMGIYTRKALIVDRPLGANDRALAEARNVEVIVLESGRSGSLSREDAERAAQGLRRLLAPRAVGEASTATPAAAPERRPEGRPRLFLNLSNHALAQWSAEQVDGARALGLGEPTEPSRPLPHVPPDADGDAVEALAVTVAEDAVRAGAAAAFVATDFSLTLALVSELQARGVRCFTTTTSRDVSEAVRPDGALERKSVFRFVRWREYAAIGG